MSNEKAAKSYGKSAVSIRGYKWLPGMRDGFNGLHIIEGGYPAGGGRGLRVLPLDECAWPDPDDASTAGALWRLAGRPNVTTTTRSVKVTVRVDGRKVVGTGSSLGRACIHAAEALGFWPGGES